MRGDLLEDRAALSALENTRQRPIGVSLLSCFAFLAAAVIALECLYSAYQLLVFIRHAARVPFENVQPLAYVVVPIAWVCVAILAWIAFAAGLDLWRLRDRGRRLTLVAMILVLVLGYFLALISGFFDSVGGVVGIVLCVLAVSSVTYLFLPGVRGIFLK